MTAQQASATVQRWRGAQYSHAEHFEDVKDICKDVYGGSDYMPRMVPHYDNERDKTMLVVMVPEEEQQRDAANGQRRTRADSVAGAFLRGDMVFLFGLRVRASIRGGGLGRIAMEELCRSSLSYFAAQSPQCLATVTIMANPPAQRVIGASMPGSQLAILHMWPDSPQLHHYEQQTGWPEKPAHTPILQAIPGAMQALQSDQEALRQVELWQSVRSVDELERALADVRRVHSAAYAAARGQAGGAGDGGDLQARPTTDGVLPFFYEVFPARCEWTEQQIAEGRVWALRGRDGGGAQGVMVMAQSPEARMRWTAGIVVHGQTAAHSALLKAAQLQPAFVAFFDLGCLYPPGAVLDPPSAPRDGHPAPPAIYGATGGARELLLYVDRSTGVTGGSARGWCNRRLVVTQAARL